MSGPIKGIKVLELAQIMAGPTCGLMLADLGADVIKIEKIPGGDDTRRFLPPDVNGEAAAFMMMNRNKRGMTLDLKKKEGVEVFKRLVKNADVVVENYRKGTLERLGIGYEELKKINPRIILCEISGYGRTGPYADKGGFDLIARHEWTYERDWGKQRQTSDESRSASNRYYCRNFSSNGSVGCTSRKRKNRSRSAGRYLFV